MSNEPEPSWTPHATPAEEAGWWAANTDRVLHIAAAILSNPQLAAEYTGAQQALVDYAASVVLEVTRRRTMR